MIYWGGFYYFHTTAFTYYYLIIIQIKPIIIFNQHFTPWNQIT